MIAPRVSNRPIVVEFFAGAGGMSLGLEQAGFDILLSVDRDGYHVATHHRNFPLGLSICQSVTELSGSRVRQLLGSDRDIDLIAGGPPCQGFSHMGTRDEGDPRNSLVAEFIRLVLELRPKAVLMENVPGMQSGKTAAIFDDAIKQLEGSNPGYTVTRPVQTLNAQHFGVPQNRERLFVIAIRRDVGVTANYPRPSATAVTVDDALSDLPLLRDNPEMLDLDCVPYDTRKRISTYAKRMRGLTEDTADFSYPRKWDHSICTCVSAVRHRADVAGLYAATRPGQMVPGHKLPKLSRTGVAPTLRAGSESEHGSYTAPRPIHPEEPRCITAREAARLHGYPDWFKFYPGKWHAYRQIGNSVCPPVARALGASILEALGAAPERPKEFVELNDDFRLPDDRPSQQPRITQAEEWPKIIHHLLEQAHDKHGRLVNPEFSIVDVERAYAATHAHMPRNPARRFLADLARSRNLEQILKAVTARGLTIIEVGSKDIYGRFVPKGSPNAIDAKRSLAISSKQLPTAERLSVDRDLILTDGGIASCVRNVVVERTLFNSAKLVIEGDRNLLGDLTGQNLRFKALKNGRAIQRGIVVISRGRQLPSLLSIHAQLVRQSATRALIAAPITEHHLAVFLVKATTDGAMPERQAVFALSRKSSKRSNRLTSNSRRSA
jgi:DNA (cytosine-5)-methyltransferase 1